MYIYFFIGGKITTITQFVRKCDPQSSKIVNKKLNDYRGQNYSFKNKNIGIILTCRYDKVMTQMQKLWSPLLRKLFSIQKFNSTNQQVGITNNVKNEIYLNFAK